MGSPLYYQGYFVPKNKQKYEGDSTNIYYRSSWELKVMKWLDEKQFILKWKSEEIVIPYYDPTTNQMRRYFPDFWLKVQTKNGPKEFIIEVKPKAQTKLPKTPKRKTKKFINAVATFAKNDAKWEYAKKYCEAKGWEFKVLTEQDIFGLK